MPKVTVILNPTAGRGAGSRLQARIEAHLRYAGLSFDIVETHAPHHASVLAEEAVRSGSEVLVAVGGDGTFNEVLNGLVQAGDRRKGVALGVIPIGTGNDFAYGAGIPLDLAQACQTVARSNTRLLDAGRVQAGGERPLYFGNGVGIGFDAMVNIQSRKFKRLRGFPLYLMAVLKTLAIYYSAPHTVIRTGRGEIKQPCLMVSVMNGCRVGGGFYVAPEAQMDDGLLDYCVAAGMSRLRMVGFVPQFMRGSHTRDRLITMGRAPSLAVTSDRGWQAHVDGEICGLGARAFEIELLPKFLRLIC